MKDHRAKSLKPTEPGYYWARYVDRLVEKFSYDPTPQIVKLELRTEWMEDDEPDDPTVWLSGSDVYFNVEDFDWISGPLDVHEQPALKSQRTRP